MQSSTYSSIGNKPLTKEALRESVDKLQPMLPPTSTLCDGTRYTKDCKVACRYVGMIMHPETKKKFIKGFDSDKAKELNITLDMWIDESKLLLKWSVLLICNKGKVVRILDLRKRSN